MRRNRLAFTFSATALAALGLIPVARAKIPPYVRIHDVTAVGSGCPANTTTCDISDGSALLTCLFDELIASSGPGVPAKESRKACELKIDLDFSQGLSFSIVQAEYRGGAELDAGVNGTQTSRYFFPFIPGPPPVFHTQLSGTFPAADSSGDYFRRDTLPIAALVWSPCGGEFPLVIKTEVQVDRVAGKSGLMTVDSVDARAKETFGLVWKTCDNGEL